MCGSMADIQSAAADRD